MFLFKKWRSDQIKTVIDKINSVKYENSKKKAYQT